jgi:hypothetical protein
VDGCVDEKMDTGIQAKVGGADSSPVATVMSDMLKMNL